MIRRSVERLDDAEAAVLREFFMKGKTTLKLPIDDETVAGLQSKRILVCVSNLGQASLAGMLFPMVIDDVARVLLTAALLRIPQPLTDTDRQRLLQERPPFVRRLDEMDALFGGFL